MTVGFGLEASVAEAAVAAFEASRSGLFEPAMWAARRRLETVTREALQGTADIDLADSIVTALARAGCKRAQVDVGKAAKDGLGDVPGFLTAARRGLEAAVRGECLAVGVTDSVGPQVGHVGLVQRLLLEGFPRGKAGVNVKACFPVAPSRGGQRLRDGLITAIESALGWLADGSPVVKSVNTGWMFLVRLGGYPWTYVDPVSWSAPDSVEKGWDPADDPADRPAEGPSIGLAVALATLDAFLPRWAKPSDDRWAATGSVTSDGEVGAVGAVGIKGDATRAWRSRAVTLLWPAQQSSGDQGPGEPWGHAVEDLEQGACRVFPLAKKVKADPLDVHPGLRPDPELWIENRLVIDKDTPKPMSELVGRPRVNKVDLVAAGGAGKTNALADLYTQAYRDNLPLPLVPCFLDATLPAFTSILDIRSEAVGNDLLFKGLSQIWQVEVDAVREMAEHNGLLVLIDGVDHIVLKDDASTIRDQSKSRQILADWLDRAVTNLSDGSKVRVVLARRSRTHEEDPLETTTQAWRRVHLQPIATTEATSYLTTSYQIGSRSKDYRWAIERATGLVRQVGGADNGPAGNAMILYLLGLIARGDLTLREPTVGHIYETALTQWLYPPPDTPDRRVPQRMRWRRPDGWDYRQWKKASWAILLQLGYWAVEGGMTVDLDQVDGLINKTLHPLNKSTEGFVSALQGCPILEGGTGPSDQPLRLIHDTIAEHLAAQYLRHESESRGDLVTRAEAGWEGVLVHQADLGGAQVLVEHILAGEPGAWHYRLAAECARASSSDDVLDVVRQALRDEIIPSPETLRGIIRFGIGLPDLPSHFFKQWVVDLLDDLDDPVLARIVEYATWMVSELEDPRVLDASVGDVNHHLDRYSRISLLLDDLIDKVRWADGSPEHALPLIRSGVPMAGIGALNATLRQRPDKWGETLNDLFRDRSDFTEAAILAMVNYLVYAGSVLEAEADRLEGSSRDDLLRPLTTILQILSTAIEENKEWAAALARMLFSKELQAQLGPGSHLVADHFVSWGHRLGGSGLKVLWHFTDPGWLAALPDPYLVSLLPIHERALARVEGIDEEMLGEWSTIADWAEFLSGWLHHHDPAVRLAAGFIQQSYRTRDAKYISRFLSGWLHHHDPAVRLAAGYSQQSHRPLGITSMLRRPSGLFRSLVWRPKRQDIPIEIMEAALTEIIEAASSVGFEGIPSHWQEAFHRVEKRKDDISLDPELRDYGRPLPPDIAKLRSGILDDYRRWTVSWESEQDERITVDEFYGRRQVEQEWDDAPFDYRISSPGLVLPGTQRRQAIEREHEQLVNEENGGIWPDDYMPTLLDEPSEYQRVKERGGRGRLIRRARESEERLDAWLDSPTIKAPLAEGVARTALSQSGRTHYPQAWRLLAPDDPFGWRFISLYGWDMHWLHWRGTHKPWSAFALELASITEALVRGTVDLEAQGAPLTRLLSFGSGDADSLAHYAAMLLEVAESPTSLTAEASTTIPASELLTSEHGFASEQDREAARERLKGAFRELGSWLGAEMNTEFAKLRRADASDVALSARGLVVPLVASLASLDHWESDIREWFAPLLHHSRPDAAGSQQAPLGSGHDFHGLLLRARDILPLFGPGMVWDLHLLYAELGYLPAWAIDLLQVLSASDGRDVQWWAVWLLLKVEGGERVSEASKGHVRSALVDWLATAASNESTRPELRAAVKASLGRLKPGEFDLLAASTLLGRIYHDDGYGGRYWPVCTSFDLAPRLLAQLFSREPAARQCLRESVTSIAGHLRHAVVLAMLELDPPDTIGFQRAVRQADSDRQFEWLKAVLAWARWVDGPEGSNLDSWLVKLSKESLPEAAEPARLKALLDEHVG